MKSLCWTALAGLILFGPLTLLPNAEIWSGLAPADCTEYCEGSDRCGALAERSTI
ncbi:MAG: hypothetical protein JRG83_01340 [Deltaproteobacteria bacterium]|nr:hypothetical protein [Deltaproteobacteria bacterium]